jgi:predicted transcriptional regulator
MFLTIVASGPKQPTSYEVAMTESADRFLTATTRIVTAWLAANSVASTAKPQPGPRAAVVARKSVFADHLVCLEDGKHVTILKRHLKTAHDWGRKAAFLARPASIFVGCAS